MSKFIDSIIGLSIGDAMGVPVEFLDREILLKKPVTKMIGNQIHDVPKGSWSDDTSLTIATIDAYIQEDEFDLDLIMKNFSLWLNEAKFTSVEKTFGVGSTTKKAINNYLQGYDVYTCGINEYDSNGNGSLMRILPVALYASIKQITIEELIQLINNISGLTHAHEISKLGCFIFVKYILYLLEGYDKYDAYQKVRTIKYNEYYNEETIKEYNQILIGDLTDLKVDDIKSTGYIVDTLASALWVTLMANNFKDAIIGAVNLGGDTDTIAAITGAINGIIYNFGDIPKEWLNDLAKKEYLIDLATKFENHVRLN